jgi:hypothetical protein
VVGGRMWKKKGWEGDMVGTKEEKEVSNRDSS